MQTLRRLPKHRPSSTAPMMMTTLAPTHHLVEQDAGGHRDIERFRAARQGNRDALRRDAIELRSDPCAFVPDDHGRSEEHTSELQSRGHLVCRLLLEKKKQEHVTIYSVHAA